MPQWPIRELSGKVDICFSVSSMAMSDLVQGGFRSQTSPLGKVGPSMAANSRLAGSRKQPPMALGRLGNEFGALQGRQNIPFAIAAVACLNLHRVVAARARDLVS